MGEEDLAVNVIKEGYLGKKMKHNIITVSYTHLTLPTTEAV